MREIVTEEDEDILIYNLNQLTEVVSENHQSIKNILKRTDKLERLAQQQLISFFSLVGCHHYWWHDGDIFLCNDIVMNKSGYKSVDIDKAITISEKYGIRSLRELRIFIFIFSHDKSCPLSINFIKDKLKYPRSAVKKVIYKLGDGRGSGYEGYHLINFCESLSTDGRTKIIVLTGRGKQLAKKLNKLIKN